MILRAENIKKQFIRKRADSNILEAVKETSLTLPEGKLMLIYGHSGSGKSTLLSMLAGLLAPTSGRVLLDDTDLYALDDSALSALRGERFGLVPQGQTAIQALSVLENVMLPFTLLSDRRKDAGETARTEAWAKELLERIGIGGLEGEMPSQLSGGELRRMAIARALVRRPAVLLADEPTADLDEENTRLVLRLLREQAEAGRSVLLVSHDREAMEVADILCRMDHGELREETVAE